jgi:hypothetical protein
MSNTPVTLLPGRERSATIPVLIGLPLLANTISISVVAWL